MVLSRVVERLSKVDMALEFVGKTQTITLLSCSELIALKKALKYCVSERINTDIWILSDSRSSVQLLSAWWKHGNKPTVNIVQHLNFLCFINNSKICFHWVPSHVNVCGNEIADKLARKGNLKNASSDGCLTFSEFASHVKQDINALVSIAPVHEWYVWNRPGAALIKGNNKCIQTAFASFP